jgi:hypothetical protein
MNTTTDAEQRARDVAELYLEGDGQFVVEELKPLYEKFSTSQILYLLNQAWNCGFACAQRKA